MTTEHYHQLLKVIATDFILLDLHLALTLIVGFVIVIYKLDKLTKDKK